MFEVAQWSGPQPEQSQNSCLKFEAGYLHHIHVFTEYLPPARNANDIHISDFKMDPDMLAITRPSNDNHELRSSIHYWQHMHASRE